MRNTLLFLTLSPLALSLASCGADASGESSVTAFSGGEAVELDAELPFVAESFGTFEEPWAFDFDPVSGMIVLTEKAGTMKVIDPMNNAIIEVTGDIPEVYYSGQSGLGDVVFAPDYAESGMLYLSWGMPDEGEDMARPAVGRGKLTCSESGPTARTCKLEDFSVIWTQSMAVEQGRHLGHRIAFSPDGEYLYVSSSDRGQDAEAQNLGNTLGTIVRLNLDGTPAAGNPFADQGAPADQIWTYGNRNPLGLAFDSNGALWGLEHGPAGGDELNLLEAGNNYGWPTRSYGDQYNGDPITDHSDDDGFVKPAIYWNPVIAPGEMIFYSGDMFGDWKGEALAAGLSTQAIIRISTDAANSSATEVARYVFPMRLRAIDEAPDGAIWVAEDGAGGRLLRLTPKPAAE